MPPPAMDRPARTQFPTTRWSRVAAAGDPGAADAREALAALCDAYWYPIYACVRRRGHDPDRALDLTQDFFAHVLEHDLLARVDPGRGRFRAFLKTVCVRRLADRREWEDARKRGGGRRPLSIDALDAEGRYAREPSHGLTAERIFDRTWALTLLARVLQRLRLEYEDSGRASIFEALQGALTHGRGPGAYGEIAAGLGVGEGAVRVAVHRLRRRYGALLRREIAATLDDPSQVDDEIRSLFEALEA